ncbi:AAA family ATPase [Acinetobacter pittii]
MAKKAMKVNSLELTDVGGIPYLKLEKFNERMNIICGENGAGKTNILDSIAFLFTNWDFNQIKRRAGSNYGSIKLTLDREYSEFRNTNPIHETLNDFEPTVNNRFRTSTSFSKKNIYLTTKREFLYKKQESIVSDPDEKDYGKDVYKGIQPDNLKSWFIGRFYQSAAGNLEDQFNSNFILSKEVFSFLDPRFTFKKVDRKNEIIVNTPSGEIYFEYLSSGFKSSLLIILGIIKEIEFRFQNQLLKAKDYDGLIMIDEVELHLHPEWQGKICNILKGIFPKAQFFITTHSPHVVQAADKDEVIALERLNGEVLRRELPNSEYGYQGWTIEEVLKDVMGMKDLRTELYDGIRKEFIEAFRLQKKEEAKHAFDKLCKMLHPTSELKAIYQMQLESLGE